MTRGSGDVVVLGGGAAGLATAWALAGATDRRIAVVERAPRLGGLAASVGFAGGVSDLGSHRIHPEYLPEAWSLLRELMGDELLERPRRGQLRLNGRFTPYPPSLLGVAGALGLAESARCGLDALRARSRRSGGEDRSFADFLLPRVGRRLFDVFYAPYARKVYGLEPAALSARAAHVRVSTGSPLELAAAMTRRLFGRAGQRVYFYPRHGFGSIVERLRHAAESRGVAIVTGARVRRVRASRGEGWVVDAEREGEALELRGETLVSTIPLDRLVEAMEPAAPPAVAVAAAALRWRGIRLLQLSLATGRALPGGETYYFPEEAFVFGRISEPSQFSPDLSPGPGRTIVNVEVICTVGDRLWALGEDDFRETVLRQTRSLGLLPSDQVGETRSLKLPAVYPVYDLGHEERLSQALEWIEGHGDAYSIGRGGQFLHANVDHSLVVGLRLARHLAGGGRSEGWRRSLGADLFRVRD